MCLPGEADHGVGRGRLHDGRREHPGHVPVQLSRRHLEEGEVDLLVLQDVHGGQAVLLVPPGAGAREHGAEGEALDAGPVGALARRAGGFGEDAGLVAGGHEGAGDGHRPRQVDAAEEGLGRVLAPEVPPRQGAVGDDVGCVEADRGDLAGGGNRGQGRGRERKQEEEGAHGRRI